MLDDISRTGADFDRDLAAANTARALDEVRVRYFGRKSGAVPALFARLKEVPKEQKKDAGDALNKLRDHVEQTLDARIAAVANAEAARREAREEIDVTLPSRTPVLGHLHPVTIVRRELEDVFREM